MYKNSLDQNALYSNAGIFRSLAINFETVFLLKGFTRFSCFLLYLFYNVSDINRYIAGHHCCKRLHRKVAAPGPKKKLRRLPTF